MVPKGWRTSTFGEIATVKSGFAFKSSDFVDPGSRTYPIVRMSDLKDGLLVLDNAAHVHEKTTAGLNRFLLSENDFVFGMTGSLENNARVLSKHLPCYLNQRVGKLVENQGDYEFACHLFKSPQIIKKVDQLAAGAAQKNVSGKDIESLSILLPPFPEQTKIARILSTWDKAIETVDKLIENSQQQRKALMQQLLTGKKRLPGFSGEWKTVRLENILSSLDAGVSVNSEDRRTCEDEKGILKTSCVSSGAFDPREHKAVIDPSETARLKEPVQKDCIIVSRMNTPLLVGANAYIEQDYPSLFLPDRLWQLKPKGDRFSMRWLGYVFSTSTMRDKLREIGTGTSGSMKNITKGDVMSLVVYAPPLPEQKSIARVLSACDKEIEFRKALRDQYQTQKQALMQQLLTGKRRVTTFEQNPTEEM